jgi:hypothetical protein
MSDETRSFEEWMDDDDELPGPPAPRPPSAAERRLERHGKLMDWSLFVNVFVIPTLAVIAVFAAVRISTAWGNDVNRRADQVATSETNLADTVKAQASAVDRLSQAVQSLATRQDRLDAIAAALAKLESAQTEAERQAALDELRRAGEMRPAESATGPPPPGDPPPATTTTRPPATTSTTSTTRAAAAPRPTTSTTMGRCALLPLSCALPVPTLPSGR